MSYRGRGYSNQHQQRRALANGLRQAPPFPADSNSDLEDNDHVRFPEIDRDIRDRKPQKRDGKLNYNSRIPLPARSNEGAANELTAGEPRNFRTRNFNSSNPEFPNNSTSDPAARDQRKSRVNAVKKITFYRNGDKHFKGVEMVVTRQRYRSFETIVDDLSKAIPLPYGVRNVFSPGGSVITTINQLEDGRHYICSSGDQLIKNVSYGEKMKDKPRSLDVESFSGGSSHSSSSRDSKFGGNSDRNPKPRVITIVSERDRNKKCKILLNTKTVKSFDAVLKDISDMLKYSVKELRNLEGIKVKSLSQLYRDADTFIASSTEQGSKRNLSNPSSNSSNHSGSPPQRNRFQKSRKKPREESTVKSQVVTIKVKGRVHTYHHTSDLDNYTIDESPVSPPDSKLQLSWVYGYHGKDSYNNLHILPSGEILYFAATMVVIYNKSTNTQRHYTGHADDIKCMAVHPNQWYIATGQACGLSVDQNELSHIRIWDAETLITLAVLALQEYSLSVSSLAFSLQDNGKQLACVDSLDDEHHLTVWEWEERAITQQSKGQSNAIVAVVFDPDDSKTLVTCGKEHVYFWRLHNTRLERKSGYFEKYEIPQYFTCLEFSPSGDVITGDSNGSITVWGKVSKKIKFVVRNAHEKSILSLRLLENGTLLSGGLDGRLEAWDANKYFNTPLHEIQLDSNFGGICAIEPLHSGHGDDISVILGVTSNDVVEGSLNSTFHPIVQSHKDEVHALAVHPNETQFISASLDHTVSLWDAETHQVIWTISVEFPVKSAAFYSTGDVLALGTTVGRWIVVSCESGMHIASFQDGTDPLPDLEYAKDGEHIAIASQDGNISVHAVYDEGTTYRRVGTCSGHSEPIMFLDWSLDGCFLQSLSVDYEHIVWEIGGFLREESQDVIRDIDWSTRNVMLGYDVAGVWPSQPDDGNLVNSSDLSWSRDIFAVGDELGYIRLFRFPCSQPGAHYHQWRGHSCPVTRMLFLSSDTYLITTGSRDFCILQWSVEGKVPVFQEEEEYGMENNMVLTGGRPKERRRLSDNESYHSDYSAEEQENNDYNKRYTNAARGKQVIRRQQPIEDRYADEEPPNQMHPTRKTHLSHPMDDPKPGGRSPRRNFPTQSIRSQQGSYSEKMTKNKGVSNAKWNQQSPDYPEEESADLEQYSDEESPRQHQGHGGRGGGRSHHPMARGQDRDWDRRQRR
ncbi:77 kDa echinoderm microtubule-associated protein [Pocillopora verrucosa]|uniref:77 kDa echinoderm microtubule-associated protein n=1 Tax=Pocillopora verrucosa TaxID=203993 RepID=UPI00333EB6DD